MNSRSPASPRSPALAASLTILPLLILAALLLTPSVRAAEGFIATLEPTSPTILPDGAAYFRLVVTNTQDVPDAFIVSTDEFDWILDTTELLSDIPPGGNATTFVVLSPQTSVTPGLKLVRVRVRSANTLESEMLVAEVAVRSANATGGREYAPSVFLSARVPERVDPREPVTLSVYLRNRNARNYPALTVRAESDLFVREYVTTLGSINGDDGEKTNQLQVQLDPRAPPGDHPLTITILVDGQVVNTYATAFTISGYVDEVRSVAVEGAFFRTVTRYTVENRGNVPDTVTFEHPTSFLRRFFTSSDVEATVSEDGSAIVFAVPLDPRASVTVEVVENFRLLVIFLAILLLCVVLYFVFRSPVVLRKEAHLKGGHTDGVSELRIRIHVKSRGARPVHNLHVVDRITSMADVVKETSLGTLQPSKIVKKPNHGTLVRWDLDALEPFEERIISYTVRAKLTLIGDVYLPAAKVKFDQHGRERTAYSNEVNIPREG
jgi:hypothetical protein